MQQVFDRFIINDAETGNYRYADDDLLRYANDWLRTMRRDEPDLFYGQYTTAFVPLGLNDQFPLSQEYEPLCMAYVVALSQSRDDEFVNNGRAGLFYKIAQRPK
jgi:hypothetical protein